MGGIEKLEGVRIRTFVLLSSNKKVIDEMNQTKNLADPNHSSAEGCWFHADAQGISVFPSFKRKVD